VTKYREWQQEVTRYWDTGLHWQEFIRRTLPMDNWVVSWIGGGATLYLADPTLQEFCAAVAAVGAALGRPPDKTESAVDWGAQPRMAATWTKIEPPHRVRADQMSGRPGNVVVTARPKGCRLIEVVDHEQVVPASPVGQRIQIKKKVLHPECAHVLAELTA